jgi:hypothetical protein
MPSTYSTIATTTLGSAAASITFSSLGSYTDIRLILRTVSPSNSDTINIRLNGDTGTNYSVTILGGNGSTAGSERRTSSNYMFVSNNYVNVVDGTAIFDFMNYRNTTTNKTVLMRSGNAANSTTASVRLWRNTAAITSIELSIASAYTFGTGTTATIYGITAA